MKKLIALIVVALFTTAGFAQDSKMQTQPATSQPPAKVKAHEDYEMKDGKLMHCTGDKITPMTSDVTLKNGTKITPAGDVKMKDGTSMKLTNGQCVSMMGSVGDCDKMHSMSGTQKTPDMK